MIVEANNGDEHDRSTLRCPDRTAVRHVAPLAARGRNHNPHKLESIEPARCQCGDQSLQP
jgi:hypothetical protein